ncbi:transposase family protein [Streptomyces griseorubiginosus]|uniref:Transposase n=1 Tax=Streptomyces griseorubiginosus TaxID=67304 RepID=A0A101S6A0_9ACTN|nr:transposase family protein [Streptomyces griseorubiginosus]KUN68240.1 transposase [Streptomyces griseorubiginosus]
MTKKWARAALTHPAFCGVSRAHLGDLIEELADLWLVRCESELRERRGAERQREAGAGPKHNLVFTDRLLVTLVHLRTGLPHAALYGIARSTISRAIGETRPLLAMRGFTVPDHHSGARLRTLADVFAYAEAAGIRLRIDGAETQVRHPKAGRPGRRAFISGKKKQNTIKTTTISDGQGRLLWSGADRPGRMHDQTAMRTEGIAEQFRLRPKVTAEVDEGYRGLANEFPDQISAPPKKPKDDAPLSEQYAWREMRRRQSSQRICVEHANAELRQWRPLQRYTGPREDYAATHHGIASLVSDHSARRPTHCKPSTELVLARQAAC